MPTISPVNFFGSAKGLIYDVFSGDTPDLSGHVIAPINTVGATWSTPDGAMIITSGHAASNIVNRKALVNSTVSDVKVTVENYQEGALSSLLFCRYQDVNNNLFVSRDLGLVKLFKTDAGVISLLAQVAVATMTAGAIQPIYFSASGPNIVYGGGIPLVTAVFSTSFMQASTIFGFTPAANINNWFDNFLVERL